MSGRRKSNELRAGLFVLLGLGVLFGAIFLLGQKSALFSSNATLYVSFDDISGLVIGAPVRLAGLDVGVVTGINFPDDLDKKRARVTLAVEQKHMPRVRGNSLAFIDSNGLLGDKVVNISMGDADSPPLKSGDTLPTGETLSFEALSNTIHEAITSIRVVSDEVNDLLGSLRQEHIEEDVSSITRSLASIFRAVAQGDGLAHRVIYDERYAKHFSALLVDFRSVASGMNRSIKRVDSVLAEVQSGDGTMHEVVYGEGGKQAIEELNLAAREISQVTREVREGEGLIDTLVYDEGNTNFLKELNEVAITVNRLVAEIEKGRGTVGGLLKDPTVYEDLKTVLGNVKRNVLFKALVRFTAEREDLRKADNIPEVESNSSVEGTVDADE